MNRCVILGQKSKTRGLQQILETAYNKTHIAETIEEIDHLPTTFSPHLLLATDTIPGGISHIRLETAKAKLKPCTIICLTKHLNPETEIELRASGLVFLGNYEEFINHADRILKCTFKHRSGERHRDAGPITEHAEKVQARLFKRTHPLWNRLTKTLSRAATGLSRMTYRIIEITIGLLVSILLTPAIYIIVFCRRLIFGVPVFKRQTIIGNNGHAITIRQFNRTWPSFQNLPLFFELLTGRLALVGTAITDWKKRTPSPSEGYIRTVKPGIFSLWQVRRAGKIAHEGQASVEWEYVFKKGYAYDFLLLLRMIPAMVYGGGSQTPSSVLRLLDLEIANLTMAEAIHLMDRAVTNSKQSSIFFVNPDCLNKMVRDRVYFKVLQESDHIFPDGIGLTIAGRLLQTPLKENINGTDMLPFLCRMAASQGYSLFLLGSQPGVAKKAARQLKEKYQVNIAGTAHGYFDQLEESSRLINQINRSRADILLVGLGVPIQETWIATHRTRLNPRILMGVGGLFDFYSGNIKRAPVWMREIGLEWVYRILQEPGRMWRRYVIGNPLFLYRVIRWKR